MKPRDAALLERAFAEAARGAWLDTAPNPRVGALALRDGHVIGYGHHGAYGGAHAEEAALRDAGAWDAGGPRAGVVDEMVVTLEPCSARGEGKKRPPCLELLRAAEVRRLLAGAEDPDPRHRGAGLRALRETGGEVEVGDGEEPFRATNTAFLRALAHPGRPWVLLKWAASLDGKTATDGGRSRWITGTAARAEVHRLRARCDAVMAGPGTLRADDPSLDARPAEGDAPRAPLRVLLDGARAVAEDARVLRAPGPRLWVAGHGEDLPPHLPAGDPVLHVDRTAGGRLSLTQTLDALRAEHGVRRLLVEGGARLHAALLDHGLADAVVRYEAPLLLGGSFGAVHGGRGAPEPALGWHLAHEERADLGPDLRRALQLVEEAP